MKRIALAGMLLILAGCGNTNLNGLNSVTLHNNEDKDITHFSVTRIPDSGVWVSGANVLPNPVKPGQTFRVNDIKDGEYCLWCAASGIDHRARQTLEGGKNFDWYPKTATAKDQPSIVEKVLRWFFGK